MKDTILHQHDDERPMTPYGRGLFNALLVSVAPVTGHARHERETLIAQQLANEIADGLGLGELPLDTIPVFTQDRLRLIARRALRDIDPDVRVKNADDAVSLCGLQFGPKTEDPHDVEEIARHAIACYESLRCAPGTER